MIDQELLIIAIIVITFINWVSTKLKERSARKKGITQDLPQEESSLQGEPIEQFNKEPDFGTSTQEDLGFKDLIAAITGNEIPQQPEPVLIPSFESEEIIKGSVDKKDTNSFSFLSNDFFSLSININQHEDKIDCLISADEWLIANKILGNYCLSIDDVEKYRPMELNYDHLRVSFEKGCYRGQEIVARMKYLGVNRRKFSTIVIDQNSNITETFKIFGDIINQKGFDIFNCMIKRDDLETINTDGSIKLII